MAQTLTYLRALADPTRLRILGVLEKAELSVHELQEITRLVQSRISTHLALLLDAGFVQSRREGKRVYYRIAPNPAPDLKGALDLALRGARELPEHAEDQANLRRVLALRENQARLLFNQVAGRFDRSYGPGRSWQAFGQMLLRLLPPLVVADLGSGEGLISELLALRCRRVIAVDNSEKIIAFGAAKARKAGLKNLEFRLGDLENPPIDPESVDLALLSQALHHAEDPAHALKSAHRILRPGGQIVILDLRQHQFEQARELYGDRWLGFSEGNLTRWLEGAGFHDVEVSIVAREEQPPQFETILATGVR
jgi:ubiquinone/menaquinone biosynthesis C-methylase UbiE/DNA-binding transcriptional ArsR family regulator